MVQQQQGEFAAVDVVVRVTGSAMAARGPDLDLSCRWQLVGGGNHPPSRRARLDVQYIEPETFRPDLVVLPELCPVLFREYPPCPSNVIRLDNAMPGEPRPAA